MVDIVIPNVITGKKVPIPQPVKPVMPPIKPAGLGGVSSGAQLLEDVPAGPTYPGHVYQEAAANLKGNPETAAQTMRTRFAGEEAARYGKNVARLGMRGVGVGLGAEQVGAAAAGDPTAIPGAAAGGAMLAGAGGAAALGGLAAALYPRQTATQAQENTEIARLSGNKFGESPSPRAAEAAPAATKPGWWESLFGSPAKAAPATGPNQTQQQMLSEQEAPFNQQVGTFNGKPVSWNQAHDLAARVPTVPAGTMPTALYNASGLGANLPSDRGEAIMNAARSGAIRPDEALRMYEGQPAREAGPSGFPAMPGQDQPQESAWARETREANAMRDLWGIESEAGRAGARPKQIAALLAAHDRNPLYQAPAVAKPDAGAQREALALLNDQARSNLEDKRFAHQQQIEEQRALAQGARESGKVQERTEAKQVEEESKADADIVGTFRTNPAQAQVLLSQLKAQVGGPAARAIMQQVPPAATAEEMKTFIHKALGGAQ